MLLVVYMMQTPVAMRHLGPAESYFAVGAKIVGACFLGLLELELAQRFGPKASFLTFFVFALLRCEMKESVSLELEIRQPRRPYCCR